MIMMDTISLDTVEQCQACRGGKVPQGIVLPGDEIHDVLTSYLQGVNSGEKRTRFPIHHCALPEFLGGCPAKKIDKVGIHPLICLSYVIYYTVHTLIVKRKERGNVAQFPPNERIGRLFVHDEVYQRLRQWIIEGRLSPGMRLRDKQLAETFGVSRTPIRESLLRLEQDGLVVTHPNRSTVVSLLDWPGVIRRYPLIWTLERYAVTSVSADVWDRDLLRQLTVHNRELNNAVIRQDAIAAAQADEAFHIALITATQNPELQMILTELKTPLKRVEINYFHQMLSQQSIGEHAQIVEGLKAHNMDRTAYAVENNWRQSLVRIQQIIASDTTDDTKSGGEKVDRIPPEEDDA